MVSLHIMATSVYKITELKKRNTDVSSVYCIQQFLCFMSILCVYSYNTKIYVRLRIAGCPYIIRLVWILAQSCTGRSTL